MKTTALIVAALALAAPLAAQDQDFFGAAVAFAGNDLLVVKRAPARGPAAVHVFRGENGRWTRQAELRAPQALERGLALSPAIATAGNVMLVGAGDPFAQWGAHGWERRDTSWQELPGLAIGAAPDGPPVVTLATVMAVLQPRPRAVAAHGNLALVGYANEARLFRRAGTTWATVPLDAPRTISGATSVALGADVGFLGAPLAAGSVGFVQVITPSGTGWRVSDTLHATGLEPRASFGQAMALDGNTLAVAAPGARTVVIFQRQGSEWAETARITRDENGAGSAIALAGNDLVIGAAASGAAFHYQRRGSAWEFVRALTLPAGVDAGSLGSAVAVGAPGIAVAAQFADGGRGRVWVFPQGGGAPAEIAPAPRPTSITAGQVRCDGDAAEGFDCRDVDLQSFLSVESLGGAPGERVTDVWGWTDPDTRREYALVGRTGGLVVVDITDAARPAVLGHLPANPSGARSVKVHANHAYVAGDGAGEHGLLVFDLTRLRGLTGAPQVFAPDTVYRQIASAHSLAVDTAAALIIATAANSGGTTCGGGLHLVDVREPKAPRFAGCYTDTEGLLAAGRTHDVQCTRYRGPDTTYHGRTICLASNETALRIVDVTDPARPVALSRANHPGTGYIHQGWLTEDQRHFFLNDELDELAGTTERTRTLIWDVSDLEDPVLVGEHLGPDNATDHNLFITGNRMYLANYQAGFRVVDITDPRAPREIGHFDTTPYEGNASGFFGAWGSYPFFPSGNVVVSSMQEGLFVLRPRASVVP